MKRLGLLFTTLITLFFSVSFGQGIQRPIGINLGGVEDYSTEFVFVDAFRQAREWITFNADGSGPWSTEIDVPVNENGYPLEIPFSDGVNVPQRVRTLMLWDLEEAMEPGVYRLRVQGEGQVQLHYGASGIFQSPIDTLVSVSEGVMLEIVQSVATNPIHSIQFIRPNYVHSYANQIFTHEFLSFVDDFQCIRVMDWLRTNNSVVDTWESRIPPNFYTEASHKGVAWETVIALTNETNKDIWINIPHLATDTYVRQLAQLLRDSIAVARTIYLEYSNEVWNGIFTQNQESATMAEELGYFGQPWERSWKYTAHRSAYIFHVFDSVFQAPDRLVKVVPSMAANPWLSNEIMTYFTDPQYNPWQVQANALAIAPYFAGSIADDIVTNNEVDEITVSEIVSRMEASIVQSQDWIIESNAVAQQFNVDLLCYEAGQHLVATGANVDVQVLTDKLIEANHHPDLEAVYCNYLDAWYEETPTLMMHFSSHGHYSKWGSWGVKETMADTLNPKYLALKDCVFAFNSDLSATKVGQNPSPIFYPNPTTGLLFSSEEEGLWVLTTVNGQFLKEIVVEKEIDLTDLSSGVYFLFNEKGKVIRVVKK